jgi:hypothetical protein
MHKICKKCILPENYSGISFDNDGVCSYCNNYNPIEYLGENKLKIDIDRILKDSKKQSKYDCVVAFSGGRDSTYLLWYVVNILKLNPLAIFSNSKLIPEQTLHNIKNTSNLLGVDLLVKDHEHLRNCIKHYLNSWVKYPTPATLITLCTGCRFGTNYLIDEEATNRNISIIFDGGTPFENGYYKKNLISINGFSKISFPLGYLKQVIKNPALISNISCLTTIAKEYYIKTRSKDYIQGKPFRLRPFINYIRWEKDKIEDIIKNVLDWKRHPGLTSAFRSDCEIGIIRQFFYNKILGYNDKDDHLSSLIRDNQISRADALFQIKSEKETKNEILIEIFKDFDIDFNEYILKFENNLRKYKILQI